MNNSALGLDASLFGDWNSTPALCHDCRIEFHLSVHVLQRALTDEYFSANLAHEVGYLIVLHLHERDRLLPVVYNWFRLELSVCYTVLFFIYINE